MCQNDLVLEIHVKQFVKQARNILGGIVRDGGSVRGEMP